MRRLPPLASVFLVVALFGCAPTVDQAPPSATAGPDDLRGTWAGTWGGAPVQLVIVEQIELGERSGGVLRTRSGARPAAARSGGRAHVAHRGGAGVGERRRLARQHRWQADVAPPRHHVGWSPAGHARSYGRRPLVRSRRVGVLVGTAGPDRDRPSQRSRWFAVSLAVSLTGRPRSRSVCCSRSCVARPQTPLSPDESPDGSAVTTSLPITTVRRHGGAPAFRSHVRSCAGRFSGRNRLEVRAKALRRHRSI
jgi:hypothetical protein